MGSFRGHILPGSFFILIGCWWMPNIFYRFYKCKQQKGAVYMNTTTYPFPCVDKLSMHLESYFKIILSVIGILAEYGTSFEEDGGPWQGYGNIQHICMYFFFGIAAVIEVSNHRQWGLPVKLDYLLASISFAVEALLFYHHLYQRTQLNVMMHMFLFYAIIECFVSCIMEMILETNMVPALFRAFFTLLQGTWFYQIGFSLYAPFGVKWDENHHKTLMVFPSVFALHIAVLLLFTMTVGAVVRALVLKSDRKLRKKDKSNSTVTLDLSAEETQPLNADDKNMDV